LVDPSKPLVVSHVILPLVVASIPARVPWGESKLAHNVVMRMLEGLWNRSHLVVTDNFFSSIGLFKELLQKGVYAIGTVRSNRVGLPIDLKNTISYKNSVQGTTEWCMHDLRGISSVLWKDKRPVLLKSTHARSIQAPCEKPVVTVTRRQGAIRDKIQTSPVLVEYTTHIRDVDVTDRLWVSYSAQVRSHKWSTWSASIISEVEEHL
jgi:hypothetical protein